jgi:hypothetical protein
MNWDEKWKMHKVNCSQCSIARQLTACCDTGQTIYRARLNDSNTVVKLTEKGKRGRA